VGACLAFCLDLKHIRRVGTDTSRCQRRAHESINCFSRISLKLLRVPNKFGLAALVVVRTSYRRVYLVALSVSWFMEFATSYPRAPRACRRRVDGVRGHSYMCLPPRRRRTLSTAPGARTTTAGSSTLPPSRCDCSNLRAKNRTLSGRSLGARVFGAAERI
jgi:hypothetical protein